MAVLVCRRNEEAVWYWGGTLKFEPPHHSAGCVQSHLALQVAIMGTGRQITTLQTGILVQQTT